MNAKVWHYSALSAALLGVFLSLYATWHYRELRMAGKTDALCNINQQFNCDQVALSVYAEFLTIPWGIWGLAFFVTLLVLLALSLFKPQTREEQALAYSFWVGIGILASLSLGLVSWLGIGGWCLVCIGVYATNLAQAVLLLVGFKKKILTFSFSWKRLYSGLITSAMSFSAVLIANNIIGEKDPTPLPTLEEVLEGRKVEVPQADIPIALTPYSGMGEDYRKGSDQARVTMVVFSDFQCPACRAFAEGVEELISYFGDNLRVVFRNYPLDQACNPGIPRPLHVFACKVAVLARCAGQYGKFWSFHDTAFKKQSELSEAAIMGWAKGVGLSEEQIQACLNDKSQVEKIRDDIVLGNKLRIDGTPSVFVNGRRLPPSLEEIKTEIQSLLEH